MASENTFRESIAPLLNRWGPYRLTRDEITETAIRYYCEVTEDANPVYWDADFARRSRFGRIIAPPQMLFTLTRQPWWSPEYVNHKTASDAAALNPADVAVSTPSVLSVCEDYGYATSTVAGQEVEYLEPYGPGDGRIKIRGKTIDVSDEKIVRVGRGVFLTSISEYRTEVDDRLIGRSTLVLLRYKADEG